MTDNFYERSPSAITPGVAKLTFERIINAAELAFKTKPASIPLPEISEIVEISGSMNKTVMKVITSKEGQEALLRRGIRWTKNIKVSNALRPEQILAISVVTDPTNRKPMSEKLKSVGISMTIWRNWMKNPVFAAKITEIGETLLNEHITVAHARLAGEVDRGNINAIKLMYEVTGRHDPAKQQMLDVARLIGLVLEVLTRHVRDPEILRKVSDDIDVIMSGKTPSHLNDIPANYVPGTLILDDAEEVSTPNEHEPITNWINPA